MLSGPNPLTPNRLTGPERLSELAALLAAGLVRVRARQSSRVSAAREKTSVDFRTTESVCPPGATEKSGSGGFFAIDRRAWARACDLGMNCGVSYLVLACGTGGDNRTTAWSENAIRNYTGLGRSRATKAMSILKQSGLVRVDEGGTRPRYYIMPAHEVAECEGHMPALTKAEEWALAKLQAGIDHLPAGRKQVLDDESPYTGGLGLVAKKLARLKGGHFELVAFDAAKAAEPDWIWLPNAIITGAASETPPVRLLRQAQNPAALRMFVNLYHSHGLADDGGIHWRRIRQEYARHKVGEHGPFVVWGFQEKNEVAWSDAPFVTPHLTGRMEMVDVADGTKKQRDVGWPSFWDAWRILTGLGLVELVAHVIEADNDGAEIIHPYAIANGEIDERAIAEAARVAAEMLVTPGQLEWAESYNLYLLPVSIDQLPNVQLVGIARLRYRPKTKATAAWFARKPEWAEWEERYRRLAGHGLQHQGNIKAVSR